MVDTPEAREISSSTVEEMVALADPAWNVESIDPAERGFCTVYRIVATREGTRQELYLKASPDGERWAIPDEARLQAVLDARTSIPVPAVRSIVDDHERFPTPFYLMSGLPGDELPYEQVGRLEDDVLRRLARESGRYLGELHAVSAVDTFGHVRHDGPQLAGERPEGTPANLTVGDPHDSWPAYLRARVERALDRHADSGFSELTPALEAWFDAGVEALTGPFDPVLGRNDHGLHNLLVDPETGRITGMIDWGYTLAVPAAFDFEFAVYLLSGAFLAGLPEVSDRRSLVREAMLAGYRTGAPDIADAVATPEPLYEALAMVRIMNDCHHLDLPEGTESDVRARIEADVRELLEETPV